MHMINLIEKEAEKARNKFGAFNSTHEAYGVLKEELEEFWGLVKSSKQDGKFSDLMIHELIQISAVALRTAKEIEKGEIKYI